MIAKRLLELLAPRARTMKLAKRGQHLAATLLFDTNSYEEVLEVVRSELSTEGREAEVVILTGSGRFVDMGAETLSVREAEMFEYYDYRSAAVAFARVLLVEGDGRSWVALYVDEVANAAWWDEEGATRRFKD